jgi:hypothetical protein
MWYGRDWDLNTWPSHGESARAGLPPPPCASTGLSKHGVGVEPLFSGFFVTAVFCGPECRIGCL